MGEMVQTDRSASAEPVSRAKRLMVARYRARNQTPAPNGKFRRFKCEQAVSTETNIGLPSPKT